MAATISSAVSGTIRIGASGWAATAPAANSSESPGRNGVTTRPVSAKMIAKRMTYSHVPPTAFASVLSDAGLKWITKSNNCWTRSIIGSKGAG